MMLRIWNTKDEDKVTSALNYAFESFWLKWGGWMPSLEEGVDEYSVSLTVGELSNGTSGYDNVYQEDIPCVYSEFDDGRSCMDIDIDAITDNVPLRCIERLWDRGIVIE